MCNRYFLTFWVIQDPSEEISHIFHSISRKQTNKFPKKQFKIYYNSLKSIWLKSKDVMSCL